MRTFILINTLIRFMQRRKKKKPRKERSWIIIHQALANIFERFEVKKNWNKDHFRLTYWGPLSGLRREAIRILNAIDGTNLPEECMEELAPGTEEFRWE